VGLAAVVVRRLVAFFSGAGNRGTSVRARVVGARSTGESAPVAALTLIFSNDAAAAVRVQAYRVQWPGGTYRGLPRDLEIDPGTEVQRVVRVDTGSGDVGALIENPARASVEVIRARSRGALHRRGG
jgi:hypothetical protein